MATAKALFKHTVWHNSNDKKSFFLYTFELDNSSWQASILPSFPKAILVLTNIRITLQHGRKKTKQSTVNEAYNGLYEENDEHECALKAA